MLKTVSSNIFPTSASVVAFFSHSSNRIAALSSLDGSRLSLLMFSIAVTIAIGSVLSIVSIFSTYVGVADFSIAMIFIFRS